MKELIFDSVILAITIITNLSLGLIIFSRNSRQGSTRAYLLLSVVITGWAASNFLSDHAVTQHSAIIMARLAFVMGFYSVVSLLVFAHAFSHLRKLAWWETTLWLLLFLAGGVISATPLVVRTAERANSTWNLPPGPLYGVFLVAIIVLFVLAAITFGIRYRRAIGEPSVRGQIRFITGGAVVTFVLSVLTNVVIPVLTNSWSISRFGPGITIILVASVGYAIVKHHLFDIRLIVARAAAYTVLLVVMASGYASLLFGVSTWLFPNSQVSSSLLIVHAGLALVMAFTFQPLRLFLENVTVRFFFRDRYESEDVINAVGKILVGEIDLDRMLREVLKTVCEQVHIVHGQFYIFNQGKIYKVAHFGPLPPRIPVVPELRQLRATMVVADELSSGEAKRVMESHGIRVSMHLRTKDEFIGFLILGDKLSGDIYSQQDLRLLTTLSSELAIAIQNAKSYAEIARFNLTLQEKIAQATKRLRTANANLKSLDVAKDEFISMASHQLRTPLTTIKGYLSMILEGDTGKITNQQREFLNYSFDGSQRMVGLISDLLNVSRLAAGRFMIERADTDLVAVSADEVRQLQTHADAKNLKLVFEPPKQPFPILQLDENKTRQVMMNFIDNAIYYTKEGSVRVSLEKSRDTVRFLVKDSGIGVPKIAQKKLFTKFFRAENAQITRPDGTGLGLYLAKRVVEDQGGQIIFSTVEGKGSTFGFEMPIKAPEPKPVPGHAAPAGPVKVKAQSK